MPQIPATRFRAISAPPIVMWATVTCIDYSAPFPERSLRRPDAAGRRRRRPRLHADRRRRRVRLPRRSAWLARGHLLLSEGRHSRLYEAGVRPARRLELLREPEHEGVRDLSRLRRVPPAVPREVRAAVPAARRPGPPGGRRLPGLGREEELRQDVDGDPPQRLRDRRGGPDRPGAVRRRSAGHRAEGPRRPRVSTLPAPLAGVRVLDLSRVLA